jgi:tRNA A37 threonylcarbamoyltransferase TsaD
MLLERNEKRRLGLRLYFGRPEYSGDNAVGAALIGLSRLAKENG